MHEHEIRERLDSDASRYGVGPVPFEAVGVAASRRKRARSATVGATVAMAVVLLGTGGMMLLDDRGSDRDRQAATAADPECTSQVRQGVNDGRASSYRARITTPDCSEETIARSGGRATSVEVWPTKSGEEVVLIEGDDEASTLKIRHLETGDTRTVLQDVPKLREARLSPDGTMIALEVSSAPQDGYGHVQLVDVKTGELAPAPETVHSARPHWSPDGSQLLYLTAATPEKPATAVAMIYTPGEKSSEMVKGLPDGLIENPHVVSRRHSDRRYVHRDP